MYAQFPAGFVVENTIGLLVASTIECGSTGEGLTPRRWRSHVTRLRSDGSQPAWCDPQEPTHATVEVRLHLHTERFLRLLIRKALH